MLISAYPEGRFPSPLTTRLVPLVTPSQDDVKILEWWLDHDGTRYGLVTITARQQVILLVRHGEPKGKWFVTANDSDMLAWSYLREKLDLRDGDKPGWDLLFQAALNPAYGIRRYYGAQH